MSAVDTYILTPSAHAKLLALKFEVATWSGSRLGDVRVRCLEWHGKYLEIRVSGSRLEGTRTLMPSEWERAPVS